jgi:hypothetical protein
VLGDEVGEKVGEVVGVVGKVGLLVVNALELTGKLNCTRSYLIN